MPLISTADRRLRLARRHGLAPGTAARTPEAIATRLVGLHGTDPTSAYLACWGRVDGFRTGMLEDALYEERSLVKTYGMRRTMFIVPVDLASVMHAASRSLIAGQRPRLERMLREAGITEEPAAWLAALEDETLAVLRRRGGATAAELAAEVDGLRARIPFGEGTRWQSEVGVVTRVLMLLSGEGRILRGRPKGSLVSSLYRWAPTDQWLPEPLADLPTDEAQAELVRRYLGSYGPATTTDIRWWTGWTAGATNRALCAIGAAQVELEGGATGWMNAGDLDDLGGPGVQEPWVALLPGLDSTIMGWQQRDWFLAPHAPRLFDTNGNAGPTIWVDGRAVGGWAQRRSGEIRWELLEDVGAERSAAIEAKVSALSEWLGPLRFLPRFRTPLEQELSA